jgi:hypothetical protein
MRVLGRLLAASLPLATLGCDTGDDDCRTYQPHPGSGTFYIDPRPWGIDLPDASVPDAQCAELCYFAVESQAQVGFVGPNGAPLSTCTAEKLDGGVVEVSCDYVNGCAGGRRPEGFDSTTVAACDEVGAWLARAAALEAASVSAFRILAVELRAHDAPASLIAAALRSTEDETRHARAVARLARRRGALPARVTVPARPIRSLPAIAVENAIEGCVREAYGARLALEQARGAADSETRAAFAQIAPDERRHAELATAIDDWARDRLPPADRRRVTEARLDALARLAREAAQESPAGFREALGLPDATRASDLVAALGVRAG